MQSYVIKVSTVWLAVSMVVGGWCLADSPTSAVEVFQSYAARGVVIKILPDQHQITVHHQAIPGYMMEMTMDMNVRNPDELKGLSTGDEITFMLNVGKEASWVDHLQRIGHNDQAVAAATSAPDNAAAKLNPGDMLPDGELIGENGSRIRFSDFRGKVLVFTFFFTRCPLPDYCPLMNRDFAQTRQILLSNPKAPANWQLISVSFDAEFDHPQTLSNYARFYRGDNTDRWLFAAAPPSTLATIGSRLGLMIMLQGTSMTHNLRTVVLDAQGRIYKQFNDNQWTPQQLADTILAASQVSR